MANNLTLQNTLKPYHIMNAPKQPTNASTVARKPIPIVSPNAERPIHAVLKIQQESTPQQSPLCRQRAWLQPLEIRTKVLGHRLSILGSVQLQRAKAQMIVGVSIQSMHGL